MIIKTAQTLLLMIFLCKSLVYAHDEFEPLASPESFKEQLQEISKQTKTIASDFIQERHISMMTQAIVSEGYFRFKRPASVRWTYTKPYAQTIVMVRHRIYVSSDDKTSSYDAQANQTFSALGDVMFRFILGDLNAAENDYLIAYYESPTSYFVKLRPKGNDNPYAGAINLYFDKKDLSLSKIIMYDSDEDFTSISFINRKINERIANDEFKID